MIVNAADLSVPISVHQWLTRIDADARHWLANHWNLNRHRRESAATRERAAGTVCHGRPEA